MNFCMQVQKIFISEKFKDTESAQLCTCDTN